MKENEMQKLHGELIDLTKKYDITSAAFTGVSEDHYIGLIVGNQPRSEMFITALNIGRLWQHMRTTVRSILNSFEK